MKKQNLEKLNLIKESKKTHREQIIDTNFKEILNFMETDVKKFTKLALTKVPEYFFKVPASTSGEHHPNYALGEGGLIRHTIACCLIALDLFKNESIQAFTKHEKSLILSSLILHDTFKLGVHQCNHTVIEHPLLASDFILDLKQDILQREDVIFISLAISSHMGQWTRDKNGNQILQPPQSNYQHFVHLCDYLAGRKMLEINFNELK